jgi:hypothetical protein
VVGSGQKSCLQNGLAYIATHHNWTQIVEQLTEIYACRYNYEGQIYICDHPVWRILYEREEPFVAVRCLPGKPEQAIVLGDDFLRVEWMGRTIPGTVFFLIGAGMLCSFIPVLLTRHL